MAERIVERIRVSAAAETQPPSAQPAPLLRAPPPLFEQFPLFSTAAIHGVPDCGVRSYVDCVRFVGGRLLTRGCDERAVLWQLPPLGPPQPGGRSPAERGGAKGRADPMVLDECSLGGTDIWFLRFQLDSAGTVLPLGNTCGQLALWQIEREAERHAERLERPTPPGGARSAAADPQPRHLAAASVLTVDGVVDRDENRCAHDSPDTTARSARAAAHRLSSFVERGDWGRARTRRCGRSSVPQLIYPPLFRDRSA